MDSITTKRPWGTFISFTKNEPSTVKLLYINKGEELSLQYHTLREEFWRVVKGNPKVIVGDKISDSHENDEFIVPININHRISAPLDDVIILEISKGQFDEDDVVRVEDKYNRA
ncbi:MAG: phosphomannose isomerase type II C-terminal cupin domain [Candidatus Zambryskibacteria bacterium]|nr:phosphomannose isomerase type II C-terminal cupin domain [Candidatus Zambryskibacteria bacterium]